jgi:predicted DNA-binding transcriptional regulator AlpA
MKGWLVLPDVKFMPRRPEFSRNQGLADRIQAIDHALSAKELARLLGTSQKNMYKLARSTIPSFHLGTSVRFDPHSVAKWLREAA